MAYSDTSHTIAFLCCLSCAPFVSLACKWAGQGMHVCVVTGFVFRFHLHKMPCTVTLLYINRQHKDIRCQPFISRVEVRSREDSPLHWAVYCFSCFCSRLCHQVRAFHGSFMWELFLWKVNLLRKSWTTCLQYLQAELCGSLIRLFQHVHCMGLWGIPYSEHVIQESRSSWGTVHPTSKKAEIKSGTWCQRKKHVS